MKKTPAGKSSRTAFDVPEAPWDLIARQRNVMRRLWNRDFSLDPPILLLDWDWKCPGPQVPSAKQRVEDPELDVRYQLELIRHQVECLKCSEEVGIPLANTPAFDLIHFGTGPLATAFGAQFVLREGSQPAFEPAVHTPGEVMKLKKPNLFKDGILPKILERIQYYNEATQGQVILTPCDTAGPWSIATSIWHYEDMLEAIHTAPAAVHHLLDMVTESIIEWYNIQEAYLGRWGRMHTSFSWPFFQRGIGIGDDCMVSVSPAAWEEFFMPYNNRLSREYGNMITYHCCMKHDTHFDSIVKTDGFLGFDAHYAHNDFDKIEAALTKVNGACMRPLHGLIDMDWIERLHGKVGMFFSLKGWNRQDAIEQAREFLGILKHPDAPRWRSDFVRTWRVSKLLPAQDVAAVAPVRLSDPLTWTDWSPENHWSDVRRFVDRALINIRSLHAEGDGLVYAGNRFIVERTGRWILHIGHDGPIRMFVDGVCVLTEPKRIEALPLKRSRVTQELSAGEHDIIAALDTDGGRARGFYFSFEIPEADRHAAGKPVFPTAVY